MNESTTLVGAGAAPLPDLAASPASVSHATDGGTHDGAAQDGGSPAPLTTTIDRSHWPAVVIAQPRDQLAWSFFGGSSPEWAVSQGPPALPPVALPNFTRKDAPANSSAPASN